MNSSLPKSIQALKARQTASQASESQKKIPTSTPPPALNTPAWLEFVIPAVSCGLIVLLLQFWHLITSPSLKFINILLRVFPTVKHGQWVPTNYGAIHLPWLYPLLAGLVGGFICKQILFAPSNSSPGQRKRPNYSCKLGTLTWDRNEFCRGWLVTGATGTGKTQVGINILGHQLFQNETGILADSWLKSKLARTSEEYAAKYYAQTQPVFDKLTLFAKDIENIERDLEDAKRESLDAQLSTELGRTTDAEVPLQHQRKIEAKLTSLRSQYEQTEDSIRIPRELFSKRMFEIEKLKFNESPWGAICMDEKGLYWQTLSAMARHYGREHHLCLLQTRPDWAAPGWKPVTRFNLLSDYSIPSNTYADAIVETATALSGGEGDKGFFKTQAQTQIGKAIELCRAIRQAQITTQGVEPERAVAPNLKLVYDLLKSLPDYTDFLISVGAIGQPHEIADVDSKGKPISWIDSEGNPTDKPNAEPTLVAQQLTELLGHFQKNYWSQPKDQLGGVIGTLQNYLAYFQTPEIAEVFCTDNTFDLNDIERGKIICVAMPQKFSIERRYVCTILKILGYKLLLRRFDKDPRSFGKKNLIVIFQDEVQRFIIKEDGNVDVIREAGGTTVMACQSKASLYPPLGGKEKANVTILNLRNRIILRAADDACAVDSADFMGKMEREKKSRSTNKQGTSYSYSPEEQFIIKPHEFRNIPDFCAVVYHASGKWRTYCIEPKLPNNTTPLWWFGGRPVKGKDKKTGKPIFGSPVPAKAPGFVRLRRRFGLKTEFVHFTIPKGKGR